MRLYSLQCHVIVSTIHPIAGNTRYCTDSNIHLINIKNLRRISFVLDHQGWQEHFSPMKSRIQYYALTTLHLDPTQARYERLRQCKQLPKAGYYTTLATASKQWPIFRITVNKMRKKGKEVLFISGRQSEQVGIIGHCYEEDSISDPVMEFVMDPHHVQFQMLYYSSQETSGSVPEGFCHQ